MGYWGNDQKNGGFHGIISINLKILLDTENKQDNLTESRPKSAMNTMFSFFSQDQRSTNRRQTLMRSIVEKKRVKNFFKIYFILLGLKLGGGVKQVAYETKLACQVAFDHYTETAKWRDEEISTALAVSFFVVVMFFFAYALIY